MKHVRDTSVDSYRQIVPEIGTRERAVLDKLAACVEPPTAYELAHLMGFDDPNVVRPRICALAGRRDPLVVEAGKRCCTVTGKRVLTWTLAVPPVPVRPLADAIQRGLWL